MHFDSEPSVDARVLTAICYLNDGWKEQDGGQLRLYPFPHDPLDIQPVSGRLVMFSSRNMLHRVLPSSKERYCFTMWFKESVGGVHQTTLPYPSLKEGADVQLVLANQEFRRLLGKAVYADEWANSLVESHPDSTGRSLALEKHWKDVGIIQHVFRHVLPELLHPKKQNLQGLRWF